MERHNIDPLRDLFLAIFDRAELNTFLRALPGGARVRSALPAGVVSPLTVAEILARQDQIDAALFDRLREARPNHCALITETALRLAQDGAPREVAVYVRSEARSRADRFRYAPLDGPQPLLEAVLARWAAPEAVAVEGARVSLRYRLTRWGLPLAPDLPLAEQGVASGTHLVLCAEPVLLSLAGSATHDLSEEALRAASKNALEEALSAAAGDPLVR